MANSWMQTPAGYTVQALPAPARAYMTDFLQVIFTPSFIPCILHTWGAAWTAGSALLLSVSAWYILRKREVELAKACFTVALPFFVIFSIVNVVPFGAEQAVEVTNYQPLKLASMEGVLESQSCAPMYLFGWVDEANQTTSGLKIPCLLSFLAYRDFNATVTGLNAFPPAEYPPINLVFQVYHLMVALGSAYIPIGLLGALLYFWKRKVFELRWVLWLFVVTVFFTIVSIIAGWWTAEVGRQPWIVYGLLPTSLAGSPTVSTSDVAISLVMFLVLYTILLAVFLFLLNNKIQHGPDPLSEVETTPVSSLPDTFRDIFRRRGARA
jgi:cytochrome d ubiquinol oxidase subunit I